MHADQRASIVKNLDELAMLKEEIAIVEGSRDARRDAIMETVNDQLDAVDREFRGRLDPMKANLVRLETDIKASTLTFGASVKGTFLHAIYSKGRVTWDSRSLEGYAAAHPEILSFRKDGEPGVVIRAVK